MDWMALAKRWTDKCNKCGKSDYTITFSECGKCRLERMTAEQEVVENEESQSKK